MSDQTVTLEVAEAEFARFCESMDLDFDMEGMDAEDKKGFLDSRRKFIRGIMKGYLVVDERGQPVFTPSNGLEPITLREPDGKAFIARDLKKKDHLNEQMFATLATMTGKNESTLVALPGRDQKTLQAILVLFLA